MNREDLKNYRYDKKWVDEQLGKYQEMYDRATRMTSLITGMPKAKNKVNDSLEELIDCFAELVKIIKKTEQKCINIINNLDLMENKLYRNVLYYRYIENKSFEEISSLVNYDYYNTCKIHGRALNEFDRIYDKGGKDE